MLHMTIDLNGDNIWPDLRTKEFVHLRGHDGSSGESRIQVAVLDGGMKGGLPSVAIRLDLPDGKTVVAETSARLFCTAARVIMGQYPNLFDGE
jgi:hypothetical protein